MSEKSEKGLGGVGMLVSAALLTAAFAAGATPLESKFDRKFGLEYDAETVERMKNDSNDSVRDKIVTFANRGGLRIQTAAQKTFDTLTR